jgi:hypothetical protein
MPIPESPLERWLTKRQQPALPKRRTEGKAAKVQNPKWNDDKWFEQRYGDPDYYSRVKGL